MNSSALLGRLIQRINKDYPGAEIRAICGIKGHGRWAACNYCPTALLSLIESGYELFRVRVLPPFGDEVRPVYSVRDLFRKPWREGDQVVVHDAGKRRGKILAVEGREALLGYRIDGELKLKVIDRNGPMLIRRGRVTKRWRTLAEAKATEI